MSTKRLALIVIILQPECGSVDNSGAANEGSGGKAVVSERFLRFLGRLIALVNASGLGRLKRHLCLRDSKTNRHQDQWTFLLCKDSYRS